MAAVTLAPEQITDINTYQNVIQFVTAILDKESTIQTEVRQLTPENIEKLNAAITNALYAIEQHIPAPVPL